jgi:hypothetical protein
MGDHPFFMWTIIEARDWLIHLPVLGFILLILVGSSAPANLVVVAIRAFRD